ncbi:MAG: phosphoglycerate kinase, partial [Anaerolineae bacterium]|nr:phosphoglycerate kinase [Anaerolineae bacterium]
GLLAKAGGKLVLPVDAVVADAFDANAASNVAAASDGVKTGWRILDIGPKTVELFGKEISAANTIVWNGPMGVFEFDRFAEGTMAVARACAARTSAGAIVVIGGGDSAAAIAKAGLADQVTHVSTGGGASLELLEGRVLPGVAALADK